MNAETAMDIHAGTALAAAFSVDGGLDGIIGRIEMEARAHAPDLSTAASRKAIASLAYQIARSKTALDEAGKSLTEDMRKKIGAVDAERKKARDRLDALKSEIRRPLDEWESAEESRVAALRDRLARLQAASNVAGMAASDIAARIEKVEACAIDDTWAEYLPMAAKAKDQALSDLRGFHSAATTAEAERAELERLRAEAAAREEADRQRKAAEDAAREDERRKAYEAEEAARIEREREAAIQRARKEADDRAAREAAEREAQHQREIAAAKAREEAAAQAERDRIAAEKRAEEEAQRRREENTRIRNRVRREIVEAFREKAVELTPENIADALIAGQIPNCSVRF